MRSSDHKAEAERLLHLARTDEGKREDDPGDPLLVLQLAQTHALLAAVPDWDDVVDAEVVDDEAADLVQEARRWASGRFAAAEPVAGELFGRLATVLEERSGHPGPAAPTDLELTELLAARGLWSAAQWGNLMLIARDTREAIVLTRGQLEGVRETLRRAWGAAADPLAKETLTVVDEWLAGFDS